ncbi:MAG: SAM-dependent methyltransferase [Opitutae bacterium]|nr:SAM-dependent methyltransferase [Opitutae bacterium]|tara:strand:- start:4081 stop:4827 length:747 start_codon:yes stop_codon:yes gene_type:complete
MNHRSLSFSFLSLFVLGSCGYAADKPKAESRYQKASVASRDGIGKLYMGREISQVMGHLGAGWLERSGREKEERTDLLVKNLGLKPSDVVADIGAGSGYFSFRMAKLVPEGKVYAVDISKQMLAIVRARMGKWKVDNVVPVMSEITDVKLPPNSVDLALIVDAYHEFDHPWEMATSILKSLKPGGRLVLIEYRMEDPTVPIKRLHKMTEAQARKEMKAAGFEWVETKTMLPQQHFMVYRKPMPKKRVD